MKTGTIYKIENNSGFIYIGKTSQNFNTRKYQHKKNSISNNSYLYVKIRELGGFDKFNISVVKNNIPLEDLNELEKYYISIYNSCRFNNSYGLNSNKGGGGSLQLSQETRDKKSQSMKGFTHTEESKHKISINKKGIKLSKEHKHKLSQAHIGKKQSDEVKQILSQKKKLYWEKRRNNQ